MSAFSRKYLREKYGNTITVYRGAHPEDTSYENLNSSIKSYI